jgi:hypothetical protein
LNIIKKYRSCFAKNPKSWENIRDQIDLINFPDPNWNWFFPGSFDKQTEKFIGNLAIYTPHQIWNITQKQIWSAKFEFTREIKIHTPDWFWIRSGSDFDYLCHQKNYKIDFITKSDYSHR